MSLAFPYNFHSHTNFSDGKQNPEEYIIKAIKHGFKAYGFSDHAPLKLNNNWCMKANKLDSYFECITNLKKQYNYKINILCGLEYDFISRLKSFDLSNYKPDYLIGAIHYLFSKSNDDYIEIDSPFNIFINKFEQFYNKDTERIVKEYFLQLKEMIYFLNFDILAHLDKIKMHVLKISPDFENTVWYKAEIESIISLLSQTNIIVEINTRGLYKKYCNEPYPSYEIIDKLYKNNIPLTISSDNHTTEEINGAYDKILSELKHMKIHYLWINNGRDFEKIKIL
ncbi:MAG: histidinol-phosphatase [Marinilabiliales bacterium]